MARLWLPAAAAVVAGTLIAGCGSGDSPRAPWAAAPGSRAIAFSFDGGIHLMAADGRQRRRLTRPSGVTDGQPAWSPTGERLAFVRSAQEAVEKARAQLLVVSPGGRPRALTRRTRGVQVADPAWSPDGTQIGFTRWRSNGSLRTEIVVIDVESGAERVLQTQVSGERFETVSQPAWSPDGGRILYTRNRLDRRYDFRPSLWVMNADGGDSRLLKSDASEGAWSPDGARIAYSSIRDRHGKWCGSDECFFNGELYVMDADGQGERRLTRGTGHDGAPAWSPDGSRIAFSSNRNVHDSPPCCGTEIYTIRPNGACLTWLTNGTPDSRDPAWRAVERGTGRPYRCGGSGRRRPTIGVRPPADSERSPVYWLGRSHRGMLLSHSESARTRRARRTHILIYNDCSRFDRRRCGRGLQLQEESVCSGQTTLNVDQHHVRLRMLGRLLLVDIGQGDLAVIVGTTEVRIFPEAGPGPARRQLLAAIKALRRVGHPAQPLPQSMVPRSLVPRIDRTIERSAFQSIRC